MRSLSLEAQHHASYEDQVCVVSHRVSLGFECCLDNDTSLEKESRHEVP